MQVEAGEVFGFLGPNGAGKTTAVKLLLGLARPTRGGGTVLGAPLGDRRARVPDRVPARAVPLPAVAARPRGARTARAAHPRPTPTGAVVVDGAATSRSGLADVGLADRADDQVGGFSKGMQQRLGLGVALLGSPALVVLDEPTSALDPVGRLDVRSIIGRARDRRLDRVPQLAPARRGRARLRPGRDRRPRPGARERAARRPARRRRGADPRDRPPGRRRSRPRAVRAVDASATAGCPSRRSSPRPSPMWSPRSSTPAGGSTPSMSGERRSRTDSCGWSAAWRHAPAGEPEPAPSA